ncbi:MAG: hypothetical protein ACK55I_29415, partial [bacterium]
DQLAVPVVGFHFCRTAASLMNPDVHGPVGSLALEIRIRDADLPALLAGDTLLTEMLWSWPVEEGE